MNSSRHVPAFRSIASDIARDLDADVYRHLVEGSGTWIKSTPGSGESRQRLKGKP